MCQVVGSAPWLSLAALAFVSHWLVCSRIPARLCICAERSRSSSRNPCFLKEACVALVGVQPNPGEIVSLCAET